MIIILAIVLEYLLLNLCLLVVLLFHKHLIILLRDEGIVLKDLSSKWDPGDRSGKWLKLKPDYIHAGADLDVLIIGLCFHFFSKIIHQVF